MSDAAVKTLTSLLADTYGNPSSLYEFGQKAKEVLEQARRDVAESIGAQPNEIIFTSGGSEADNQAILSAAKLGEIKGKKHIISTAFEHHAVLHTLNKLKKEGFVINHKTVYRIMKELGLKNVRRKCKYRSYVGQVGSTAPNIVNRDFSTTSPNQKWTTDVTQISVGTEKCYLSPILDMYNGEIVSYVISDRADLKMVMDMLDKACESRVISEGLILHSDQGWQYQHYNYQQSLKQHGIIQSMSRKGNCLDNAMMENFFGIMKSELLYPNRFQNMAHFKQELVKYIDYYNKDRIKLRLNGMSPVQYRTHNAVLS